MPQCCGDSIQGVADGMSELLGEPVTPLRTPEAVQEYKQQLKKSVK